MKDKENVFQLAEINVARMKGLSINDPIMKEFVDNLDRVNALAETSEGFVWRLKDESNNATNLNPYNDEQVIVNISVWQNVESLEHYVYKTFHTDFLKRRREWFQTYGKVDTALWWVPQGKFPTVEQAVEKLDYFEKNGASPLAFSFRNRFPQPN